MVENKKVRKTLFWGVNLRVEDVMNCELVKSFLELREDLVPLKSVHSTLLFVGRKENEDEKVFEEYKSRKCKVVVSGYGYSEKAMALKVESMKFDDDSEVPTFAETQHITVALGVGIKPVESVKTLLGEGEIVEFEEVMELEGKVFRY